MTLTVLGIAGSLRRESFNAAALRAAQELAPDGVQIEIFGLNDIPPYDEDVYQESFPPAVQDLRERIAAADALLIATPEYNYSIPGVLKNAIDWASRPPDQPFNDKPAAIMGASAGRFGTARAQHDLRKILMALNTQLLNKPEVMIGPAGQVFEDGRLVDEDTRKIVARLVEALAEWTRRLKGEG